MNAKAPIILGIIAMVLVFAITKDITFAAVIAIAEILSWHAVRAIKHAIRRGQ